MEQGHEHPGRPEVYFGSLTGWYQAQCAGNREHSYGVKLETLDNPGWLLTIDLIHTDLQGQKMTGIEEGCNLEGHPVSLQWLHCSIKDNQFRGASDPTQVERMFCIFEGLRNSSAAQRKIS